MFDVITFGSATEDVFLKVKSFKIKEEKKVFLKKDICFPLGAKIPVKKIEFLTGGGGTNVAVTFANQGFKVGYFGKVGNDLAGQKIKKELEERKVSTEFLFFTSKKPTNFSVILPSEKERTIFVYKGASGEIEKKDLCWKKLKAKWFYLAPLSGKMVGIFEEILIFAKKNKIKVAINPGEDQLSLFKEKLKKIFSLTDVLILNQEEASRATGHFPYQEKAILKTLKDWSRRIFAITKGPLGGIVFDGKSFLGFEALKVKKIVDRTGCGDAFGSGFVSGLMRRPNSIEFAIQLGAANATGVLQKIGAKNGLLKKGDSIFKFGKVKIKKLEI